MCVYVRVSVRARSPGLRCKTALSRLCYFIHKPGVDYPGWVVTEGKEVGCGKWGVDAAAAAAH